MVEPGVGSDPDAAIGTFVDDAHDVAGQRVRVVALMAEVAHAVAGRVDQAEAAGGAGPDPPGAVFAEKEHQIVGEAGGIVIAMSPGAAFATARIETNHANAAARRPDRAVAADDEGTASRVAAFALYGRLRRDLAGFRIDRGDAEIAGKPDLSRFILDDGFDLDGTGEGRGECLGNGAVVVAEAARCPVMDLQAVAIGTQPEATCAILEDGADVVGRVLVALQIGIRDEAEDRSAGIRLAQACRIAAEPEQSGTIDQQARDGRLRQAALEVALRADPA